MRNCRPQIPRRAETVIVCRKPFDGLSDAIRGPMDIRIEDAAIAECRTRLRRRQLVHSSRMRFTRPYFSSSMVTATSAFADSRTLSPSTSATRLLSMK